MLGQHSIVTLLKFNMVQKGQKWSKVDENLHKAHNLCGKEALKLSDLWLKYFKKYGHCIYLYI